MFFLYTVYVYWITLYMYMLVFSQTIIKYLYTVYVYCGNKCLVINFCNVSCTGSTSASSLLGSSNLRGDPDLQNLIGNISQAQLMQILNSGVPEIGSLIRSIVFFYVNGDKQIFIETDVVDSDIPMLLSKLQ